jgi:membrane-bound inhibitor of C-type lysozyme
MNICLNTTATQNHIHDTSITHICKDTQMFTIRTQNVLLTSFNILRFCYNYTLNNNRQGISGSDTKYVRNVLPVYCVYECSYSYTNV